MQSPILGFKFQIMALIRLNEATTTLKWCSWKIEAKLQHGSQHINVRESKLLNICSESSPLKNILVGQHLQ